MPTLPLAEVLSHACCGNGITVGELAGFYYSGEKDLVRVNLTVEEFTAWTLFTLSGNSPGV